MSIGKFNERPWTVKTAGAYDGMTSPEVKRRAAVNVCGIAARVGADPVADASVVLQALGLLEYQDGGTAG